MKLPSGNTFLNPERILREVGITPGQRIADLGCGGAGYFVLQAAKMVGDRGVVYGVDVLKHALSGLQSKLQLHGITNVVPVWSNLEIFRGAKQIHDGSLDIALLVNTLFQSSRNVPAVMRESARMIAPGGILVVIEWKTSGLSFGPAVRDIISPQAARDAAGAVGLTFERAFDPGKFHFGLIFRKGS